MPSDIDGVVQEVKDGKATVLTDDGALMEFNTIQLYDNPTLGEIARRALIEQQAWTPEEREKRNVNKNPVSDLPHWGHDRRRKGEQFGNL